MMGRFFVFFSLLHVGLHFPLSTSSNLSLGQNRTTFSYSLIVQWSWMSLSKGQWEWAGLPS